MQLSYAGDWQHLKPGKRFNDEVINYFEGLIMQWSHTEPNKIE